MFLYWTKTVCIERISAVHYVPAYILILVRQKICIPFLAQKQSMQYFPHERPLVVWYNKSLKTQFAYGPYVICSRNSFVYVAFVSCSQIRTWPLYVGHENCHDVFAFTLFRINLWQIRYWELFPITTILVVVPTLYMRNRIWHQIYGATEIGSRGCID